MLKYVFFFVISFCILSGYIAEAQNKEGEGLISVGDGLDYVKLKKDIEEKREILAKIERDIAVRQVSLEDMEKELNTLVSQVEKFNKEAKARCSKIALDVKERVEKMVKIYEKMAPEDSAARLAFLEEETVIMLLGRMKDKRVAEIFAFIEPKKAAAISQNLLK